ncbi:MAG: molybdate ABC transporter substrate-binding protein [Azospirillaceae bacterium]
MGVFRRIVVGGLLASGLLAGPAQAEDVLVFAAASLTDALGEAADSFQMATGHEITLAFAGSSTLARQIESGAPAEVFLSANVAWMDHLAERGLILPESRRDLVGNDLVVVTPADSAATLEDASGLPALIGDGRLAIADPDHVPAGIYARESLETLGLWPAIENRTARGTDVRATLALVERGEVPAGIVYRTDAAIAEVRVVFVLPPDSHAPIIYPAALTPAAGPAAEAFLDFLGTAESRRIFHDHGFSTVDGDPADPA